ncbi:conserved domain protein [Paraprevotella xylaniphila YIT 11841]|uniref:Conserved domain protein n=1 Tax=Paraprevotella xylaniphila YIT 11841 TaxID=762982 RepID=F3QTL0_9BACT|nr:conserved domain protein [Paraprevotella xylaniphila YIT 11841]
MPERRHCILWIRPRMAKYFQADMKTVYLLGRDGLSHTISSHTESYR